jgi:hypothetical protein
VQDDGIVVEVEQQAEDADPVAHRPVHDKVREECGQPEDHIQRHKDAQCAANVEVAQAQGPGVLQLPAQQRGNQVAAEKEKNRYAERRRDVVARSGQRMGAEDHQERNGPDAVQPRDIGADRTLR